MEINQKLYAGFSKAGGRQRVGADFSQALTAFKRSEMYKGILRAEGVLSSQHAVVPQ